jgi:hypothetical protein
MPKQQKTQVTLVSAGKLLVDTHYGPFSRYWWTSKSGNLTSETENQLIPIRVGQKTRIFLNEREFVVRVVVGNKESPKRPGYCCESGEFSSNVETSATEAISSLYMQIFHNKTRKSGAIAIGYDNQNIIEELQEDVPFFPFFVCLDKFKIFVSQLGVSSKSKYMFHNAGPEYISSFIHVYNKNQALFVSKIKDNRCAIEIYQGYQCVKIIEGYSPNEVWEISGILQKKFDGITLFGLNNPITQKILIEHHVPTCKPSDWTNYTLMETLFKYHLKRRTNSNTRWYTLFENWINNKSSIIELYTQLKSLYPVRHKFGDREIRAWQCMLKAAGCYNITPFTKKESKVRFFVISLRK